MSDPTELTAGELSAALAAGETSAAAATEAYFDRIATLDGELRAYITVMEREAREAASASDRRRRSGGSLGPLDGVPIAVKDNIDVAGVICTAGIATYRNRVSARDADCIARLRAAGAVILGKLNLHEGALGATTDNAVFGRCENPLRPGYTPGGSSGGSGAAVAARLCAAALGTDTMGSVRIPAAYCGIFGLLPTADLISTSGVTALSSMLDRVGPLTRSLDDLALVAEAMAEPRPEWTGRQAAVALVDTVIGRPTSVDLVACEPRVRHAFDDVLDRLRSAGAQIIDVEIDGWDPPRARRAGLLIGEAEGAVEHETALDLDPDGFSGEFRSMLLYGRNAAGPRIVKAYRLLHDLATACSRAMAGLDALILPTAPQTAFPHDEPAPINQADLTALANFAGRPAVTFPVATDDLPAGIQLVGHRFGETRLLELVRAIARS